MRETIYERKKMRETCLRTKEKETMKEKHQFDAMTISTTAWNGGTTLGKFCAHLWSSASEAIRVMDLQERIMIP